MDYSKYYKQRIKENIERVLNEIDTPDMKTKIQNWADKFGYSFEDINNKAINDEIFRCAFAIDPGRQNIYQTLAADFIKSINNVSNFEVLPAGGANALYLVKGKILNGKNLQNQGKDTKSIDFKWNYSSYTFYASHKYTKDSGGAQDNQYRDVQDFLENARDYSLKNTIFLAICDGQYYQERDSKTNDDTKIKRLERLTDNRTTFALTIDDLKTFLKKYKN